jgi:hypothetical protein
MPAEDKSDGRTFESTSEKMRRTEPLLTAVHDLFADRLGADQVEALIPGYWIEDWDISIALRVSAPAVSGASQGAYGHIFTVALPDNPLTAPEPRTGPLDPDEDYSPDYSPEMRSLLGLPDEPTPDLWIKLSTPVILLPEEFDQDEAIPQINQVNKSLLRTHLTIRDYGNGLVVEIVSGLPSLSGTFDSDLLLDLFMETVGVAGMINEQLIEALGAGRTALQ